MQINRLDFNSLLMGIGTTPSYLNTMRYKSLHEELQKELENREMMKRKMMRGPMIQQI
jgi:hypothetical protein